LYGTEPPLLEPDHPELSIREQCRILGITRASYYYYKAVEKDEDRDLVILNAILEELKVHPFYGYRKIARALADMGVTRKQVRRIMHKAGLRAIYPKKRTSIRAKGHKKYPYLLKNMVLWIPNQAWATDITYIKLGKGFVYLVVILDLYSRKILSWKVSNTMDTDFCVAALEEAINQWGIPAIFNTDQGVSLPAMLLFQSLNRMAFVSAWIAKIELWIIFTWNEFGVPSSTKTSISKTIKP
jgi:putative transposase